MSILQALTKLSQARFDLACASLRDLLVFAGGTAMFASNVVDFYNATINRV
jgi:hypothetical protein